MQHDEVHLVLVAEFKPRDHVAQIGATYYELHHDPWELFQRTTDGSLTCTGLHGSVQWR